MRGNMGKWQRINYQPLLPLGKDGRRVTGSQEHIALSHRAAGEGMVLLKNEGALLPLCKGARVALFGKGTIDYVKGGGGSGDVTVAYIRNLYEGMKRMEQEGLVELFHELPAFYEKEVAAQYAGGAIPGMTREPEVSADLMEQAREAADVAIVTICRFSGEGWDRTCRLENGGEDGEGGKDGEEAAQRDVPRETRMGEGIFERGDFYLSRGEEALVKAVTENFEKVIVVMNVGGMVDSGWFRSNGRIQSVLMAWQGGMEGGLAAAEVLCGEINPSGRLVDTFADSLESYPSTANFHESPDYVEYTEDIYVGYRYFETIPGAARKVNYPFGFGLSYTDFDIRFLEGSCLEERIHFTVSVKNTGERTGREVVQVYVKAPRGKLGKPAKVLVAFGKTVSLAPGEEEKMELSFPVSDLASFDDTGKVCASAYVLEEGDYSFYVGKNVRDAVWVPYGYRQQGDRVVLQLSSLVKPKHLSRRLKADGTYEELPGVPAKSVGTAEEEPGLPRQDKSKLEGVMPAVRGRERVSFEELWRNRKAQLIEVAEGKLTLEEFLAQLDDEDLIHLLGGQPNTGVANTFGMGNLPEYGVPNVMTADGPAGLRISPPCGICTTAFPCATLLACTWDTALVEEVGAAAAEEVKENHIGLWLAPALNIHRSPLCGRNFEYYSEDPLVAGKIGAAMVRGVQSQHIGACPKHFACNNKETNRKDSDSRVSERALREIYLKGFEIIVKEADPYMIMTSYNLINGVQASENKDLLTGILRGEWGYKGMVTTDWWTHGEHYREIKAGNDVKMGNGYPERVMEALEKGFITREEIAACAGRVLEMILKMD